MFDILKRHYFINSREICNRLGDDGDEFDTLLPHVEAELAKQFTEDFNDDHLLCVMNKLNVNLIPSLSKGIKTLPLALAQFNADNKDYAPGGLIMQVSPLFQWEAILMWGKFTSENAEVLWEKDIPYGTDWQPLFDYLHENILKTERMAVVMENGKIVGAFATLTE